MCCNNKKISEFLAKEKHTKKKHVARLVVKWQRTHHYQNCDSQRVGLMKNWWYQGCNEIVDLDEHGMSDPTPISAPSKKPILGHLDGMKPNTTPKT